MQRIPILSETDMNLFELKTRYARNYLTFAGDVKKDPEQTWILALSLVKP